MCISGCPHLMGYANVETTIIPSRGSHLHRNGWRKGDFMNEFINSQRRVLDGYVLERPKKERYADAEIFMCIQ